MMIWHDLVKDEKIYRLCKEKIVYFPIFAFGLMILCNFYKLEGIATIFQYTGFFSLLVIVCLLKVIDKELQLQLLTVISCATAFWGAALIRRGGTESRRVFVNSWNAQFRAVFYIADYT